MGGTPGGDLLSCPACGTSVHERASECPRCGFRTEARGFDDLLTSLSTVSSIIVGFGLAALVSLATDDSHALDDPFMQVTAGCWIGASILLLVVLVVSELIRRADVGQSRLRMDQTEMDRIEARCLGLIVTFGVALLATAVGVVLVGFHFSWVHGAIGCTSAVAGLLLIAKLLR